MLTFVYNSCIYPLFSLDHVRHRNFGVLLEHAGHQAVTPDVIDALKQREEESNIWNQKAALSSRSAQFGLHARTHLADVARPRCLLLARWSQQDDGERLTVGRLHHDFKLQMVEALTCRVVCKNKHTHSPRLS